MEETKNIAGDTALDAVDAPVSEIPLTPEESVEVRALMEAGVFYGQNHSRTNPKMNEYILTSKGGVEIIDLAKTLKALVKSQQLIREKILAGEEVVLVGTTPAGKGLVKALGEKLNVPNVTERWLGGTLTNFKTISDRIRYFKKLKADAESGALDKYTKKERVDFNREIGKLTRFFSGIESLEKLPGLVVIFGLSGNETPAREAKKIGIKSIAFMNTASNPDAVSLAVPGNESNPKSLAILATYVEKAIFEAKQDLAKKAAAVPAPAN
jgi:small subunit ribosomal protein S2